ncbi:MAG TPA: ABC transporter substrate-binding protein [Acetobacteraceae bacterium]|jgi:iron complex transport system substrate-binding protein|nr:ABC transporter substrate-binding protein [Acetobacteraceae bacterium]
MLGRIFLVLLLLWSSAALAAEVTDATGRVVQVPDKVVRVLPAGPPAAVLLVAVAPDLMLGWPSPVPDSTRALLAPAGATLPQIPRLTGRDDVTEKIQALKPDLILDYGTVSPRYADLARATQQKTGVPTILLDGSLTAIPQAVRTLGGFVHREGRAETLATFAEALLALQATQGAHPRVLYARGADGLTVAAPGTDVTEVFTRLGWQVVAPDGNGTFRQSSIDAIRVLDPDILIFSDPAMRETVMHADAWRTIRAVRDGHALVAPGLPFGWVEEPPSINRLLGLAWLSGRDPVVLGALFNAAVYGRALTSVQLDAVLAGTNSFHP